MSEQVVLSEFDERMAHFAHVRALILKIVNVRSGLTVSEITEQFRMSYGFTPIIDNRLRELRKLGDVKAVKEEDGLLHIYPNKEEK